MILFKQTYAWRVQVDCYCYFNILFAIFFIPWQHWRRYRTCFFGLTRNNIQTYTFTELIRIGSVRRRSVIVAYRDLSDSSADTQLILDFGAVR